MNFEPELKLKKGKSKVVYTLFKKDLFGIIKEKSFVFIILSQLIVLILSSTFAVFVTEIQIPKYMLNVCTAADEQISSELGKTTNVYRESLLNAFQRFGTGTCDVVLISEKQNNQTYIKIFMSEAKSFFILPKIKDALKKIESDSRNEKIASYEIKSEIITINTKDAKDTKEAKNTPRPLEVIYALLLPLLVLSAAVISGNLVINLISEELESKTMDVLLTSTSYTVILSSKALSSITLVPVQAILWIIILGLEKFPIANTGIFLMLAFFYAIIFISFGMISIKITKNRDEAQNLYGVCMIPVFISLLPMPYEIIEKIGFLINLIPSYQITRSAIGMNYDALIGFALTGIFALALFFIAVQFSKRKT